MLNHYRLLLFLFLSLICLSEFSLAGELIDKQEMEEFSCTENLNAIKPLPYFFKFKNRLGKNNTKLTAACLALTLGPFGMHRLYLGTAVHVPVVYVFTVGGGLGLLPLIDLIAILSTQNIDNYLNNKNIFMWLKE